MSDQRTVGREATADRRAPAGAPLHHVALRTADVGALAAFYVEVFGLPVVRDARPASVWLALDERSVLMIERRTDEEPAIPAGSMELLALAATPEDRAAIRERALRRGCLDGQSDHTVYLRDPDGRRVGASSYPFASEA